MPSAPAPSQDAEAIRRIKRPIFIVGCCNSGTTLLWQALLKHPDVSGPPMEGQDIEDLPSLMRHFLGKATFRMFAHPKFKDAYHLTEEDYDPVVADKIDEVYGRYWKPGTRFLEKSPANSMRTRFIQSIYPDATFIIMVRNGYAVAEGIVRKRLYDTDRPHMAGLQTTITEAAEQWYHANHVLVYDMAHLTRSMVLPYETMVAIPTRSLSTTSSFCGLSQQDQVGTMDVTRSFNDIQIARLTQHQIATIRSIAGNMLDSFGYAPPGRGARYDANHCANRTRRQ